MSGGLYVVKIGGSVLTGIDAYRQAAAYLAGFLADRRASGLLVIVSAEQGQTDALLATARAISDPPDAAALDLLWSTGELRSVALLVLALQAAGLDARGANVHQTGVIASDARGPAQQLAVRPHRLLALLAHSAVVVVPGFLARSEDDGVVSLGRGGSDLTAVLLAAGVGARECVLVKDVAGYYTADPHADAGAQHLPALDFAEALHMADTGCALVQRDALAAAARHALPLSIRSMQGTRHTRISATACDAAPAPG
jgi:aspartate kinase